MPTKKKPANKKGVATPKGTKVKEVEVKETKDVIPTSEEIKDKNHIMGKTESYNVHPMERDLYHVSLEKVKFNSDTGERLSKPFVQKFDKREWANFQKYGDKGYTINILWSPQK